MQIQFSYGWNPQPKRHLLIALLLAGLATVLTGYFAWQAHTQLQRSQQVRGLVVDSYVTSKGLHTPLIEYTDLSGKLQQFKSSVSTSPQQYFIDDQVDVLIDPISGEVTLGSVTKDVVLAGFFGLFSLIAWIGAFGVYWIRVRSLV
jgi:type II secretory pathway pseudopilin PulG